MNLAGKNIKCIAFDLDHTVINSDGTMSDATRTVIEQAIAEGIEIIPEKCRQMWKITQGKQIQSWTMVHSDGDLIQIR